MVSTIETCQIEEISVFELTKEKINTLCINLKLLNSIKNIVSKYLPEANKEIKKVDLLAMRTFHQTH